MNTFERSLQKKHAYRLIKNQPDSSHNSVDHECVSHGSIYQYIPYYYGKSLENH